MIYPVILLIILHYPLSWVAADERVGPARSLEIPERRAPPIFFFSELNLFEGKQHVISPVL